LSRRLFPTDREKSIVAAATAFFAEHGLGGQTRELAAALRITQPLLYRYFSSKDALIEGVYQEVFVGSWIRSGRNWLRTAGFPLRNV
jgi:AcrR family transcriptional regulator